MKKIIFANQLRGIASLLVMISHWLGVFWGMREIVATYTMSPVTTGENSLLFGLVSYNYLNFGPLGVSIFFLISGFVIPITLEKSNVYKFFIARAFRIFPTYMIGLGLGLSTVWLSGIFWGKPFIWNKAQIISNLFLINPFFEYPSIDLVNWTLTIELLFYVLSALLVNFIRKGKVIPIILFSLMSLGVNLNQTHLGQLIGFYLFNLNYMLIGTLFYYAFQLKISNKELIFYIMIVMVCFGIAWKMGVNKEQFPIVTLNYFYGLIIFGLSFFYRDKFKPLRLLDWAADISFPLYIIHSLVGYSFIKLFMALNITFVFSALITLPIVILMAYTIHFFIEIPSTKFGKELHF